MVRMNREKPFQNDAKTDYIRQFRGIIEFERRLKEIEAASKKMDSELINLESRICSSISNAGLSAAGNVENRP